MTYEDFLPHVLTVVPACPRDTALRHIRLAAIEFCARTLVWREDLDGIVANGGAVMAMPIDDQVEIVKLLRVEARDEPGSSPVKCRLTDAYEGREALMTGSLEPIAWTDDLRNLTLQPPPKDGGVVSVMAALKPSMASFSFPDHLFSHHVRAISCGALAKLFLVGEWKNVERAADYAREFNDAASTTGLNTERGNARRRKPARFF